MIVACLCSVGTVVCHGVSSKAVEALLGLLASVFSAVEAHGLDSVIICVTVCGTEVTVCDIEGSADTDILSAVDGVTCEAAVADCACVVCSGAL